MEQEGIKKGAISQSESPFQAITEAVGGKRYILRIFTESIVKGNTERRAKGKRRGYLKQKRSLGRNISPNGKGGIAVRLRRKHR